ncbi:DNA polymerase III subunit beta [Patescibacteria group bacterium]|nr:DNA polymerase III subunit beta [Patescibacteria group bacterium]
MKITLVKEVLLEKLNLCSRFTANKITTNNALEGIMLKKKGGKLIFYATDLTRFIKTETGIKGKEDFCIILSPKKIVDFLNLLTTGPVDIEVKEKAIVMSQGKARGSFPLITGNDFPLPPALSDKVVVLDNKLLGQLDLITFASSEDSVRPALTGTNFVVSDNELTLVATDGFRLSFLKSGTKLKTPSMLVPSVFLDDVVHLLSGADELGLIVSEEEKMIAIKSGETVFYSRLIQGEFPAYERVIPTELKTTVRVEKDELLRNIKLISVFARDQSNIVVLETLESGLKLTTKAPDADANNNYAMQDAQVSGDNQHIAFNYRFVIDLLTRLPGKEVVVEILRGDAPVVFKSDQVKGFLHIIMPVRIGE